MTEEAKNPLKEAQTQLLKQKQEYFEKLKREADAKKQKPAEDEEKDHPKAPIDKKKPVEAPKKWEELTPAQR